MKYAQQWASSQLVVIRVVEYILKLELLLDSIDIGGAAVWIYMVGSSIALLEELVLIVLFLLKAQLRESPGDIFFGSLFFEMILATDLLLTSLLDQLDGPLRS